MRARGWFARALLAVVAAASFFGGTAPEEDRALWGAGIAVGTVVAIGVDLVVQRSRRRQNQDLHRKLQEVSDSVNRNSAAEVLHLLSKQVFAGESGWRISLYQLDGATWRRLARAASHEMYERSGRSEFLDDQSFMIRFRSRNLGMGEVAHESSIKMPDRNANSTEWHIMQAEEGRLDHVTSASLLMPTRVYSFAAFRVGSSPFATLALCLETLGEHGIDEVAAKREIRPLLFESLARLVAVSTAVSHAPGIYADALRSLNGTEDS